MILALGAALALAAPDAAVVTVAEPPVVDGVLDEPAWQSAPPVTDFLLFQPVMGGPPEGRAEVRFLQDDQALYIGVKVTDTGHRVRARISQREAINSDDQIGIYLDPFGNAQSGYIFYFNPLGIQQDIRYQSGRWNMSWDAVYTSRGRVVDDGFELEIALPFRSLKYPRHTPVQDWGLIVTWKDPASGTKSAFPRLEPGHPRIFVQAARLRGVSPPDHASGVEVVPGAVVRFEGLRDGVDEPFAWTPVDPWFTPLNISADVRVGLSPNVGFTGTINPDFSEVESDVTPVVLNQRFAVNFPERRRFFTDGLEYFQDPLETLYTRSIVRPLEGLKVSGREGDWTVGVLQALDRSPLPSFHERSTAGFAEDQTEGAVASNAMLRLRRDLPGAGAVGLTLVDKRLLPDDWLQGERDASLGAHDALALDATLPFGDRWTADLASMQSLTGPPDAVRWGQRNLVSVSRGSGRGLGLVAAVEDLTEDFRQELGFLNQSGLTRANLDLDWTVAPGGRITTFTPFVSANAIQERNGDAYRDVGGGQTLVIDGIHALTANGGVGSRREQYPSSDDFSSMTTWWASLKYSGQIGAAVEWTPRLVVAREMDFRTLTPSLGWSASLDASLRPANPLRIDTTARVYRLLPEGGAWATDTLWRTRVQWQLTRTLGLRVIEELNAVTDRPTALTSSALVTWQLHPFTAAYVGYAERATLEPLGATGRSVFVKVHVLLRP